MLFRKRNQFLLTLSPQNEEVLRGLATEAKTSPEKKAQMMLGEAIADGPHPGVPFYADERPVTRMANEIISFAIETGASAVRIITTAKEIVIEDCFGNDWRVREPRSRTSFPSYPIPLHYKEPLFRRYEIMSVDNRMRYGKEGVIRIVLQGGRSYSIYLHFAEEEDKDIAYLRI